MPIEAIDSETRPPIGSHRMFRLLATAIWLAALTCSNPAAADPPARSAAEPDSLFPVAVEPHPSIALTEIMRPRGDDVLVRCTRACTGPVIKGRYMIRITDFEGNRSKELVDLNGPTQLVVTPPDRETAAIGLALGIVGIVTFSIGGIMLILACRSCALDSRDQSWVVPAGASGVVLGAIGGPVGWLLFGINRKVHIDKYPFPMAPQGAAPAAGWSFRPVRVASGALGALELRF